MIGEILSIQLTVNGVARSFVAPAAITLLDLLRDQVALTGTKECCDVGECGACTVLMDGDAVDSCLVLAAEADGHEIMTVEGLTQEGTLSGVQEAFLEKGAVQCGFCIPGQLMAAHFLLQRNPYPTITEIREGLSGNLCRCGCYVQICDAVMAASEAPR